MEIENKHSDIDISRLLEDNKKLKEENDHLKWIQEKLLSDYYYYYYYYYYNNNKQPNFVNEHLLREYALNNSIESIITVSSSGEILYLNDTTWKRLGYEKEDLVNKNISTLDPNFSSDIWPAYWSKLKKLKTFSFFSQHKNKEGLLLPVEVTPTYLVYNNTEYCIAFAKDVSNIKAAEEIITETELLLNSVIVNSYDSIALSSLEGDNSYRLLYMNTTNLNHINKYCKTNYVIQDLIGKPHGELFLKFYKSSIEEFEFDNQKRREAIEKRCRIFYEESLRSGEDVAHLESSITPIFNEDGKCTHTLWSARDITEKKKAEEEKLILFNETLTLNEELKANEEELRQILDSTIELNSRSEQNELKLRAIFDSSESIYYLLDITGKVLWYNKPANDNIERRFNRSISLGTNIKEYMDVHLQESYEAVFKRALQGEKTINERQLIRKDNTKIWIQTTMIPVYGEGTGLMGISMNVVDITERKRREEELNQINQELIYQNQQLNQYSYIVSHNLRGPIATILGLTNVFEAPSTTEILKEEIVKHIQKSSSNLDTIIRDLNAILSQTKEVDHVRTLVDLSAEMLIVQDLQMPQIGKAEATFVIDFSKAPLVFAIKSFVNSILSNLVSNSLKYKKPNVPVTITIFSERKDNTTIITYADNGLGIDLGLHKDKIFGFYKRFHSHVEGKGMGLHLVKTQVEMMGGRIEVESEVNRGTIFRITLKDR